MSLTTLIDDRQSAVSLFMAERFPNTRALQKVWRDDLAAQGVPTMRPASAPAAHPWGVIGSAIDYRIRYYFGLTPTADLIAVGGLGALPGISVDPGSLPVELPAYLTFPDGSPLRCMLPSSPRRRPTAEEQGVEQQRSGKLR
jgi:hypothetical protein